MRVALEGFIHWGHRYADAAEAAAVNASDPVVREAHLRVARACRHVPGHPARDLFEGLQAIILVHLAIAIEGHGMSVSIGLPDRALAPFLHSEVDLEYATQLASAFMLKVAANSLFGRGSKTQAITVGGADHEGRDWSNALTLCFMEACNRVRVGDPHLFLRWHPGLDEALKVKAVAMLAAGVSMPLLIHDKVTAGGFERVGIQKQDAWDYCVIGCNELGIPGRLQESAASRSGSIQYLELLNEVLLDHPDPDRIRGMGELMSGLEGGMARTASARRMRRLSARNRSVSLVHALHFRTDAGMHTPGERPAGGNGLPPAGAVRAGTDQWHQRSGRDTEGCVRGSGFDSGAACGGHADQFRRSLGAGPADGFAEVGKRRPVCRPMGR
jgi:hypothetical protein